MIDHLGLKVSDFKASKAFYDAAFAPLKVSVVMAAMDGEWGPASHAGYGKSADSGDIQAGKPSFWITDGGPATPPVHVAFVAETRGDVDAFYAAAIAAGGRDNGPPGLRPEYHPNYYGAFVFDPDGHNVEAVCHRPG